MNQEAHELAGVLGSPFLSVSEGRGSSHGSLLDSFVVRTGDGYNISISVDIFSSLTWLPRLDQLLTKIENKFYLWKLHKVGFGVFMILYSGGKAIEPVFNAGTPEDAAAEALIWILRQGKSIVK